MCPFQEIWCGPINDERGRPDLKDDSLKPSLFVLREDNTLTRYDLDTGVPLQSVFLSSRRKFVDLRLNANHPNVVVKSTKQTGFCSSDTCDHKTCNKTKFCFITFTYRPLRFEAHLQVTPDIFGKDLYNAVIGNGFLMVISHHKRGAKLYSFDYILRHFFDQTYRFLVPVILTSGLAWTLWMSNITFRMTCVLKPFCLKTPEYLL